jgi:hypothetical protein
LILSVNKKREMEKTAALLSQPCMVAPPSRMADVLQGAKFSVIVVIRGHW